MTIIIDPVFYLVAALFFAPAGIVLMHLDPTNRLPGLTVGIVLLVSAIFWLTKFLIQIQPS